MVFERNGFLAMFVLAATLPLAGPASAESTALPPAAIPLAIDAAATAPVASVAAATAFSPAMETPSAVTPASRSIGSGIASFYGRELAGARTASGQRFNPAGLTAAHRTLPFGTQVQVTNPRTGDSVIVTINDRGPFHANRVIDLSEAAARQIGIARMGSGMVKLAVISPEN